MESEEAAAINGWTPDVIKTVTKWQEDISESSFIYGEKLEEQENYIKKSLIVISTIPLVLLGVYVGHWIMGLNMTMLGMIGIVGLAGVVVNDGLIMVDFIKKAKDTEELMKRAKTRLRPILLTSLTTVLGLLTLIFFASGQAMILQPMAVSLGFGIAWATVLNLLYVPLMYSVAYRIKPPQKGNE
jgi:multidrug efflux pump subunit AcrB